MLVRLSPPCSSVPGGQWNRVGIRGLLNGGLQGHPVVGVRSAFAFGPIALFSSVWLVSDNNNLPETRDGRPPQVASGGDVIIEGVDCESIPDHRENRDIDSICVLKFRREG